MALVDATKATFLDNALTNTISSLKYLMQSQKKRQLIAEEHGICVQIRDISLEYNSSKILSPLYLPYVTVVVSALFYVRIVPYVRVVPYVTGVAANKFQDGPM